MSLQKNIFYTFITQMPVFFFGIFVGIFITRMLGVEGKGIYAIFQSDLALFVLLLSFNIDFGVVYFVSRNQFSLPKMLGLSVALLIFVSVLLIIFLYIASLDQHIRKVIFPSGYDTQFYYIFLLLGFLLTSSNSVFSGAFRAKQDFKTVNQVALLNTATNFSLFLVLFLYHYFQLGEVGLFKILLFTLIVLGINTAIWIYQYVIKIGICPEFGFSYEEMKLIFSFVFLSYLSQLINLLNYRMDYWILGYYSGVKVLGLYSLSVNMSQLLGMVTTPILQVLQPSLNSPDEKEVIVKFMMYSRLHFTVLLLLSLILYLLADWIIPLVYGANFELSSLFFKVLIFGVILSSLSKVFAITIINSGKVIYNLIATIIGLILTITLDFWLIPLYGAIGASVASVMVYLSIFMVVFYFNLSKLKMPIGNYFILLPEDIKKLYRY